MPNKSLKAVRVRSLDSFSRRMLRILRAALRCPLARRYVAIMKSKSILCIFVTICLQIIGCSVSHKDEKKTDTPEPICILWSGPAVKFPNEIYFKFNSYQIGDKEKEVLYNYSKLIRSTGDHLKIHGYADKTGNAKYNIFLSRRRAGEARKIIINQGVSPEQIEIIAHGEKDPVYSGDNMHEYYKNRMVRLESVF